MGKLRLPAPPSRAFFHKLREKNSPPRMIAVSYAIVILFGALLLMLPVSHHPDIDISPADAFFTATSAVSVTGLVTLTTSAVWSLFGKTVILLLIQVGGLSFITIFTYFLVHLGKKVTLKDRLVVQAVFNTNDLSGMVRLVLLVIRGTLICEGIGAAALAAFFMNRGAPIHTALYQGIFHSVSAFCNAGFDLVGERSFEPYSGSVFLNLVIMALIFLGGIGFTVWRDVFLKIRYFITPALKKKTPLSLHSKFVLITSAVLIVLGTAYFFITEYHNPQTLGPFSAPRKLLASLFQSVTLRTAGFATIGQDGLYEFSKLVSCVFMLIGGSPGGTAGGIKTVTVAIVLCSVWNTLKGRRSITVFERTLSPVTLQKAITVIIVMLSLWLGGTILLSITEQSSAFAPGPADLLFEVASALGTVGLSTGLTPFLSAGGKIVIMLCMFIGRIGPIALILSLSNRMNQSDERIRYPGGDVMIG